MNKTKANVNSTKDVIAMLDDLIDDNTKTLKKEITMKKADKKVDKKVKAVKKATKEERRLRIEKAAKKTDGKKAGKKEKATKNETTMQKADRRIKAEKAAEKAERAAKKVDKKAKADKKAARIKATPAQLVQEFIEYKPAEIRAALLQLTQAKRNFLRRAIDKVDLTVEKKADKVNKSDEKADKKIKADKKDKFGHEIVRIKKNGTPMKTVYASFKELATTLKIGKPVEVAVYSTLGKGRGKQRFLTGYKIVTRIAKDKQTVKKSKRPMDTE